MLPFVQVEADFITSKAPRIAALAGIPAPLALGHSVMLISFIVPETSSEDTPPDGILLDPDAAAILEAVVGWTGEPGRLFSAWVRGGLVEKLEVGARVRGLDRYREAWESAKRSRERAAAFRASKRTGSAPQNKNVRVPNANETRTRSARSPGDEDGDVDGDQDPLPSEVKGEKPAASPPPVSPPSGPVGELRDGVDAAFLAVRGAAYVWSFADERAVARLLAHGTPEILRRWGVALRRTRFPQASTVCDLLQHWNAYAAEETTGPPRQRDVRRGVARAEDQDHSRTEVDADGTVHF